MHRFHIVQEFNKGVYEYILASDESAGQGEVDEEPADENSDDDHESSNGSDVKDGDGASTSIMTGRLISALTRANTAASEDEDIEDRGLEEDDSEQTARKKRKQSPTVTSSHTAKRPRIASNPPTREQDDGDNDDNEINAAKPLKRSRKRRRRPGATDKEFGVSRGVDFVDVAVSSISTFQPRPGHIHIVSGERRELVDRGWPSRLSFPAQNGERTS